MDWLLALGSVLLLVVGFVGVLRPDLLWRLYSLEPRWRKNNPEKPADWQAKSRQQGYVIIAIGVIFMLLSFVLV